MKEKVVLKVTSKILVENFSTWFLNKIGRTKHDSFYYKFYVDGSYNHEVYLRVIISFGCINYFGTHIEQKFTHVKKPVYKFLSSLVDFKKEHIVMSFIKKNCDIVDSPTTSVQFYECIDDLPF